MDFISAHSFEGDSQITNGGLPNHQVVALGKTRPVSSQSCQIRTITIPSGP